MPKPRASTFTRHRGRLIGAGAVLVAALVVGIVAYSGQQASSRFGSAPRSYVVVYRDVINGVTQWEVLAAQRPFDGSDLTYRTPSRPDATAKPDGGTISTATGLYTETARGVRLVSGRQPGPPSNDLSLAVEMKDAVARGVAVDLHQTRKIAGFTCSLYRLADPASGPLHRLDVTVGHDDVCLARNGLLLSETWTYHGSVVEQRTAMTVTLRSWPAGTPRPGSTTSAAPASNAAAVVTPDAQPSSFLAYPAPATGFRPAMPAVDFRLPDSTHPTQTVAATVVWSFVHDGQLVTVEAGRERGGVLPWSPTDTPTRPVRLAGLGAATTALRSDGPEVRIDLGDGRWVRVRGTVPLSVVSKFAATLRLR